MEIDKIPQYDIRTKLQGQSSFELMQFILQ